MVLCSRTLGEAWLQVAVRPFISVLCVSLMCQSYLHLFSYLPKGVKSAVKPAMQTSSITGGLSCSQAPPWSPVFILSELLMGARPLVPGYRSAPALCVSAPCPPSRSPHAGEV